MGNGPIKPKRKFFKNVKILVLVSQKHITLEIRQLLLKNVALNNIKALLGTLFQYLTGTDGGGLAGKV